MLDLQSLLSQKVAELRIPRSMLAAYTKIWQSDLSTYLNGTRQLRAESERALAQAVSDIERLIKTLPVRPDLRNPILVREAIEKMKSGLLRIEQEVSA